VSGLARAGPKRRRLWTRRRWRGDSTWRYTTAGAGNDDDNGAGPAREACRRVRGRVGRRMEKKEEKNAMCGRELGVLLAVGSPRRDGLGGGRVTGGVATASGGTWDDGRVRGGHVSAWKRAVSVASGQRSTVRMLCPRPSTVSAPIRLLHALAIAIARPPSCLRPRRACSDVVCCPPVADRRADKRPTQTQTHWPPAAAACLCAWSTLNSCQRLDAAHHHHRLPRSPGRAVLLLAMSL
jgi:hypothetical protein